MFTGCGTAMVTPFRPDGSLDESTLRNLIRRQIDAGIDFLVPCGTTGESPTLSHVEHLRVVEITVELAKGRVPVLAGAGGYNTAEVIAVARELAAIGADGILSVTPYYNKPTQEGMYLHFKAIADAVDLPMIIYNIPPRSVVDMSVDTMARLAKHKNIIGVKDATANLTRPLHTRRACGDDFCQLSGEDHTALSFNAAGGIGCISVTANVAPRLVAAMQDAWMEGRLAEAMAIQNRLVPLHDALFSETSPAPVKFGASLLGKTSEHCRLPLAPIMESTRTRVRAAMTDVGLLN
jgi:4-hydroxy-tetrahydrodipicolinate synthase